ncbi:MAG TPA: hypothetical protein VE981_15415 [Planctomycetota bacterium]|nr:hypothetical protein [Planctomycetota bacterium]
MRIAAVCVGLLLLLSPGSAQDKPEDEAAKKAQQIQQAVGWVENEDADVREMGRKRLLELGRASIPAIEKRLVERKVADLVQILREIDHQPSTNDAWVTEQELKDIETDEQFKKEAERASHDSIDKVMTVKYQEAMAHVRHKNYQRAFDMANALIALDARSKHLDDYKRLRRHCENMITQTTLIEAKILQPRIWYVEGESVELSVRMKNLYKAPMTLTWEKGTEKEPGGGMLLLDVEIAMRQYAGASSVDQRHQDLRFEEEIPIAPGAQWERKFVLDTSTAIEDPMKIRIATVGGWTQPARVQTDGVNITRRIQFEPAVVKILPARFKRYLDDPIGWFRKLVAEGNPDEIYACSQLLEEADKDQATAMVIQLLAKSTLPVAKADAASLLTGLTGMSFGTDPKRWESWLQNKILNGPKDNKKK